MAEPQPGCMLSINCEGGYTVTDIAGRTVAHGAGDATVALPGAGMYIVSSAGKAVKVFVR